MWLLNITELKTEVITGIGGEYETGKQSNTLMYADAICINFSSKLQFDTILKSIDSSNGC